MSVISHWHAYNRYSIMILDGSMIHPRVFLCVPIHNFMTKNQRLTAMNNQDTILGLVFVSMNCVASLYFKNGSVVPLNI